MARRKTTRRRHSFGASVWVRKDPGWRCRELPHRTGRVDHISYTSGGYQITGIDGDRFGTLWDWREMGPAGFGAGAVVEFVVDGRADPYTVPYAEICRVVKRSSRK